MEYLMAVLELPNRSYTAWKRGAQFFQSGMSFRVAMCRWELVRSLCLVVAVDGVLDGRLGIAEQVVHGLEARRPVLPVGDVLPSVDVPLGARPISVPRCSG